MLTRTLTLVALLAAIGAGCKKEAEPRSEAQTSPDDDKSKDLPAPIEDKGPADGVAQSQKDMAEALEAAKKKPPAQPKTPVAGDPTQPTIKMLGTGAAPRRELRMQFVKGTKEQLILTTNQSISSDGVPVGAVPTSKMVFDVQVLDVASNGDAEIEFEVTGTEVIGRPGIPAMVVTQTRQGLDMLEGLRITSFSDTRGFTRDFSVELPPSVPTAMRAQMAEQMTSVGRTSAPFPLEAIGVGATWELHQTIESRGMRLAQITTFELVEMNADSGTLKTSIVQVADRQMLPPPQPGTTAELIELQSKGEGRVDYDLNALVTRMSVTLSMDMRIKAKSGGQVDEANVHIEQAMELNSH
jgi:hypothetical protein